MALLTQEVQMTEEEYIQFELNSEIRHEYVNGKLIDIPGESLFNNEIAQSLLIIFRKQLKPFGYNCYIQDVKVKVPGENKYFCPDLFITKEDRSTGNKYIRNQPEIIVEVLSKRTRKYDTIDKFINYQKFDSLQYYILIEPDFPLVTLYYRSDDGTDWLMETFTDKNGTVALPSYNFTLSISEVYEG